MSESLALICGIYEHTRLVASPPNICLMERTYNAAISSSSAGRPASANYGAGARDPAAVRPRAGSNTPDSITRLQSVEPHSYAGAVSNPAQPTTPPPLVSPGAGFTGPQRGAGLDPSTLASTFAQEIEQFVARIDELEVTRSR